MVSHSDNFNAGGIPFFLIVTLIVAVVTSRAEIFAAFRAARVGGLGPTILFFSTALSAVLSISLYFTAAWAYGLVCTIICYVFALVSSSPESLALLGRPLLIVQGLWLAVLVGVPDALGVGVIGTVTSKCDTFYGEQKEHMCKTGWLAFNEIVAMYLISVVFLTLLTLVGKAIEAARNGSMESKMAEPPTPSVTYQDLRNQLNAA